MPERLMKDSGVEWLNSVPSNWDISRIGELYSMRNTKVSDTDYQPLSVGKMGVVPQLEHAAKSDDGDNRKLVLKGDFAINSRSDRRNSCGISEYDGSVSLINTVFGKKMAEIGNGRPITKGMNRIEASNIVFYDTEGYEITSEGIDNSNFETNVKAKILDMGKQELKKQIHL